jgi:hypothetical protein
MVGRGTSDWPINLPQSRAAVQAPLVSYITFQYGNFADFDHFIFCNQKYESCS